MPNTKGNSSVTQNKPKIDNRDGFKPKSNSKGNSGNGTPKTGKKGFKRRPKWVEPWPENKPYMSKAGGSLSRECQDWIKNFCFKCGCDSHSSDVCRTYPEKTVIMNICSYCRQGFHDPCRSRRIDLKTDFLNKQIAHLEELYAAIRLSKKSNTNTTKKIVTITPPTVQSDSESE